MNKPSSNNLVIAVWELTLRCNLQCIHCGSSAGTARTDELSTTEALHLCDDLAALGCKGVALLGGEVFLRPDWQTISKEIKHKGMVLSIITNGFHDPDHIIPILKALETDSIVVGLDGATPKIHDTIRGVPGSFQKAIAFLQAAKKTGIQTSAITTVQKSNYNELPKILKIILDENINWQIQEGTPIGRFPQNQLLTKEEYYTLGIFIRSTQKKYTTRTCSISGAHNFGFYSTYLPNLSAYPPWQGCYAGKNVIGIQSNGNIKGCLALPDDYIEGNIRKRSINDIWNDPKTFRYSRHFNKEKLGNNCKTCTHRSSCGGGCTTRSVSMTGNPHNDPYCFYRFEQEKNPCV
jgi:radical SAM protein with 4Fe4S-binding SPASM domain